MQPAAVILNGPAFHAISESKARAGQGGGKAHMAVVTLNHLLALAGALVNDLEDDQMR